MATLRNGLLGVTLGAEDLEIREAELGLVSRFRMHVTAVTGTITIKARIQKSGTTAIAANVVYPIGSTTAASTITATGIYDIEASGLEIQVSSGTSCTFDAIPVVG